MSHNKPQRATTSHNEPQRTTMSDNQPQPPTTSYNKLTLRKVNIALQTISCYVHLTTINVTSLKVKIALQNILSFSEVF